MKYRLLFCLLLCVCHALAGLAATPLQTFTVKDYLQHQWTDELVHFTIAYPGKTPKTLMLTDAAGQPVPCQVTGLTEKSGTVTGTVWTVVTVPPKGEVTLHLQPGTPAQTPLRLLPQGNAYVLGNEKIVLRLPRLSGTLSQPVDLTALPAPLLAVMAPGGQSWLGAGAWVNTDKPLLVKEAKTTVLENGPVRVTVRYRLTFTDDRYYQADITLGARQDAALFTDDTDVEAPGCAFRFAFQQGLGANRLYWKNNYFAELTKGLTPAPISFEKEQVLIKIYPWSYWWLKDQTTWAGFYQEGAQPFVGVLGLHPSRWTPVDWGGFDRTAIPITARPGGQLDITLGLLAWTRKQADGTMRLMPLHRELAFTLGTVAEHVTQDATKAKLRRQLIQYSEFPLDEVKDYGFDYPAAKARTHPFLLISPADIDRVRRQAQTVPVIKAEVARATKYIEGCGGDHLVAKIKKSPDGWREFYRQNYLGNYLFIDAPTAYLGSANPKYGILLAAGVKGMARENMETFLEAPVRPSIGGYGPWYGDAWMRLLQAYDVIAATDYLTPEEKREIEAVLVFGAHFHDHPDYWNTQVGLCTANESMTTRTILPRGLLGLFLDGHPKSAHWLKAAEDELQRELQVWVHPGGAFVECPYYTSPWLDGVPLLMQAIRNVTGRDYFADPRFKAMMDYYGFILTPPDVRFPPVKTAQSQAPMTLPSIGDGFSGFVSSFHGWMARATAQTDPAYSARLQFYWKSQNYFLRGGARADGFLMALCDPELPATPPHADDLSRPFPGFGSILRSSWTDPKATYVAHRAGPDYSHYHDDFNEIVLYAKGAPLCLDFGNLYQPVRRAEPWYHNLVSLNLADSPQKWGIRGEFIEARILPHTIDYSYGKSWGGGSQQIHRHVLLIKSADPLGANYLVMRDATVDGQPNQQFFWNLWCLSKEPEITGTVAHFPGQLGVDLDAHVLSPANPQFIKDFWNWSQHISYWGQFSEEQHGIHVRKPGSAEDFFTVLYPRAAGQGPAQVTPLGDGRGVEVKHMEGADVILHSPGKPATITAGDVQLTGEVAFARRDADGTLRLAVVKGAGAMATLGSWGVRSDGPVALAIAGTRVTGESSGEAHTAQIALPATIGTVSVALDGKAVASKRETNLLIFDLPAGSHAFTITVK